MSASTEPTIPSDTVPPAEPTEEKPKAPSQIVMECLFKKEWKEVEETLKKYVPMALREDWDKSGLTRYNPVLFLDQSNSIGEEHADRIYSAISAFKKRRDVLLIVGSRGGRIEPAYLVSKNCKAAAKDKFVVAIPRRAKSAATLLSLGADEIHMGSMSELGPIDPQLGRIPALSLTNALQTLARLVTDFPGCADMFAKYLQSQLDLGMLGYFERINQSAIQYASRLLAGKTLGDGRTPEGVAGHLVNHYKDHSFVIDKDEALELLGPKVVKIQTSEYQFSNSVDQNLRWVSRIAKWVHKKEITFVGSFDSCLKIRDVAEGND